MIRHSDFVPFVLVSVALAACSGQSDGNDAPIAPRCDSSVCAEVDISSTMACYDVINEQHFTTSTRISGRTTEVSCGVDGNGTGRDLSIGVRDGNAPTSDSSEVWFRLRNYTGPGTYPLFNLNDEGDHLGLKIVGNTGRTDRNAHQTIGTVACIPQICEAIVSSNSDPLPNDDYSTHEFRVKAEIRCPSGGKLTNMHCDPTAVTECTFTSAPTLKFEVACRH